MSELGDSTPDTATTSSGPASDASSGTTVSNVAGDGANSATADGLADVATDGGDIGTLIASIAALASGAHSEVGHSPLEFAEDSAGSNILHEASHSADGVHEATSLDLGDVGAAIQIQTVNQIASTHLDLHELTTHVNLFDFGHTDFSDFNHHS